ncbi:MAG: ankyrin repeat domain-containing protein [Terracidiphilus sp.]
MPRVSVGVKGLFVLLVLAFSSQMRADSSKDLLIAVNNDDLVRAQKALRKGASPDTADASGTPVLVLAAGKCQEEIVDLLIKSGASVEKVGASAFQAATHCSCWDSSSASPSPVASILLAHGVRYPAPGASTCTDTWKDQATEKLKALVEKGSAGDLSAEFVKPDGLVKQYADLSAVLRGAVDADKPECAKLLLAQGANPNLGDERGETPLMLAADQDRIDLAQMLIGAGADPSRTDADGQTAERYAVLSGDDALIRMLVPKGQTLSPVLAIVAEEHEVYLWKGASGGKPAMHWKVHSAVGKADITLKSVSDANSMMSLAVGSLSFMGDMIGAPEGVFLKLNLAPSEPSDSIAFDSGTWQLGMNNQSVTAPISFRAALPATGEKIWVASDGNAAIMLQPTVYLSREGRTTIGGAIATLVNNQFSTSTVTAQDASLSGTIRFPADHAMEVKPGFRIRGGGLKFDETGISLMPGTHYVKDATAESGRN